ncbi:MAG TPA: MFS transporter [Nitrospiria bacterium]|nr:MFS transporter [Nitrospiria bacterium]
MTRATPSPTLRSLLRPGDVNAFFGLMVDNMTQLVILAAILTGVFGMPREVILHRMIPGSAVSVLAGDLITVWLALRLARRTGRTDVTAMPLGIDTPSLFAFAFGIIGPAYLATKDATLTWQIAMAVVLLAGLLKIAASFIGPAARHLLPRAALLGPIAAVAIIFIAFFPSMKIIETPIVGLLSLAVIFIAFIGKIRLPGNVPAALAAVALGTGLYYLLMAVGLALPPSPHAEDGLRAVLPLPSLGFLAGLPHVSPYLALALPFALVVVVGGIDVTESAAVAGDDYDTRSILLTDGIATCLGGLCGGVVQTTPYIGHPAYKQMGGGAGYTLATALFIGLGGWFGYLGWLVDHLPEAAVAPIMIFIGVEIFAQAFHATPAAHYEAVAWGLVPVLANLVLLQSNALLGGVGKTAADLTGEAAGGYQALVLLGNGFIITSLLWAAALSKIIDHQLRAAAGYMTVAAVASLVGLIHSPHADGRLFWPFSPPGAAPWLTAGGYLLVAVALLGLSPRARR